MGELRKYRWDTRRVHKRRENFITQLDIFDYVVITIIFALWVIILRFGLILAVTTTHCIEAFATFGQTESTPSIFDSGASISAWLAFFWTIVAASRFRAKQSFALWAAWHGVVLSMIGLLWVSCFFLTPSSIITAPDGVVDTRHMIRAQVDGETIYEPYRNYRNKYGHWQQGSVHDWTYQRCVWLDEGLVMDWDIRNIEDYNEYKSDEWFERPKQVRSWPDHLPVMSFIKSSGFQLNGNRRIPA